MIQKAEIDDAVKTVWNKNIGIIVSKNDAIKIIG